MSAIKTFLSRKKETTAPAPACTPPLNAAHTNPAAAAMPTSPGSMAHGAACFADIGAPLVMEFFQSQGCASCPPAVPGVHAAAMGAGHNVLLLTHDVTYWDRAAGWADTFGSSRADQRQHAFARRWQRDGLFTPQVVVGGAVDAVGASEQDVHQLLHRALEMRDAMGWSVSVERNLEELIVVSNAVEAPEPFDLLLVKYDPATRDVKIGKGPNKGKKVKHTNVVQDIVKIGEWRGGNMVVPLPPRERDGSEYVAILQAGPGGPIPAALKL